MPGEGLLGGPLCPEHLAWRGSGGRVQARAAQAGFWAPWSPLPGLLGLRRHLPSPLGSGAGLASERPSVP